MRFGPDNNREKYALLTVATPNVSNSIRLKVDRMWQYDFNGTGCPAYFIYSYILGRFSLAA